MRCALRRPGERIAGSRAHTFRAVGARQLTSQNADNAAHAPHTVLVIDDNAKVRDVIARQLRTAGYETLEASDGSMAIHLFGEHAGEIVAATLDLEMPETDGREVLAMLSEFAPSLPILVVTGSDITTLLERRPARRGLAYLTKPFENVLLLDAMQSLIDDWESTEDGG